MSFPPILRLAAAPLAAWLLAAAGPAELFGQRCAMCHQSNGAGLPGMFPRLAGRASAIAQSPPGRRYLALVLLNGMVGPIVVDGQRQTGLMPSMAALTDQNLADLLNHAIQLAPPASGRKPAAFTASEVAAVHKEGSIPASAVSVERAKLVAAGLLR